jgi:hypothetical protein
VWMMGRTFLRSPLLDARFRKRNLRIFAEDHAVLRRIRPECVPQGWHSEVSVKSDALQIAFRQRVQALEQRGWIAAPPNRADDNGETRRSVNVIACPARHEVKTWALDAEVTAQN